MKQPTFPSVASESERGAGVLLIGHGTRDRRGTDQFFELGRRLSERLEPIPVAASLLEFQEPTIAQGWRSLVDAGANHVHVAPLLLFAAGHAKQDVPEAVAQCQLDTPEVSSDQCRPLSRHPAIVQLAVTRLRQTIQANWPDDPERIAVVMVGRGSHDPCASADMRLLSEIVRHRVRVGEVQTAFYAMASPTVPEVIDRVAQTGRFDKIIVHPHLLFAGRLHQAIVRQTEEGSARHRNIQFATSDYLGPDDLVARAIADRCGVSVQATCADPID